jgi:hypothetical protein
MSIVEPPLSKRIEMLEVVGPCTDMRRLRLQHILEKRQYEGYNRSLRSAYLGQPSSAPLVGLESISAYARTGVRIKVVSLDWATSM